MMGSRRCALAEFFDLSGLLNPFGPRACTPDVYAEPKRFHFSALSHPPPQHPVTLGVNWISLAASKIPRPTSPDTRLPRGFFVQCRLRPASPRRYGEDPR